MLRLLTRLSLVLTLLLAAGAAAAQYEPTGCTSADEEELIQLINQYRADNGLGAVPVSQTLALVAQWHVADHDYASEVTGELGSDPNCNLHSWYGVPGTLYTTCCYTADHAEAACMWGKPTEISEGSYTATGYELAAAGYETVEAALQGWQNSPPHNDVILNLGFWSTRTWQAMGVGVNVDNGRYFLWFAEVADPEGSPEPCPVAAVSEDLPGDLQIRGAHPNPFSPRVSVSYELAHPSEVRAAVLDAGGRVVRNLGNAHRPAGHHEVVWDGADDDGQTLSNGVYFVRVWASGETRTSKVAMLR